MTENESRRVVRPWEVIARRETLDRRPYAVLSDIDLRLPDGEVITNFLRITLRPFVNIFAVIETLDESGEGGGRQIPLVWQYRVGPEDISIELPAGAINPGELPLAAAQRELLEESGLVAKHWQPLGKFFMDSNYEAGIGHFFLATGVQPVLKADQPDHGDLGDLVTRWLPLAEVRRMWRDGQITSAPTALSIALALQVLDSQNADGLK
jgi:ADP-ribose pyrophosphatase